MFDLNMILAFISFSLGILILSGSLYTKFQNGDLDNFLNFCTRLAESFRRLSKCRVHIVINSNESIYKFNNKAN